MNSSMSLKVTYSFFVRLIEGILYAFTLLESLNWLVYLVFTIISGNCSKGIIYNLSEIS